MRAVGTTYTQEILVNMHNGEQKIGRQKKRKWLLHVENKGIALEVLREKTFIVARNI